MKNVKYRLHMRASTVSSKSNLTLYGDHPAGPLSLSLVSE